MSRSYRGQHLQRHHSESTNMKLSFLGATGTVTGSRIMVTHEGKQLLVDCGLFQGYKNLRLMNWEDFPFDPR